MKCDTALRITEAHERRLWRRAATGCPRARLRLVELNMGLVWRTVFATRRPPGVDQDDLVADAVIALVRAVELYQPGQVKFSTYACQAMRNAIQNGLDRFYGHMSLPVHVGSARRMIFRFSRGLAHDLGRDPNCEELAEASGLSVSLVASVASLPRFVSLEQPLGDDDDDVGTFADTLVSECSVEQEAFAGEEAVLTSALVAALLADLSAPERDALILAYGLEGFGFGVSSDAGGFPAERRRCNHAAGLRKLRAFVREFDIV